MILLSRRTRRSPFVSRSVSAATLGVAALFSLAAIGGCGDKAATAPNPNVGLSAPNAPEGRAGALTIAWAEWEPAKQMEKLAADFTKETKIPVVVQQIPWSEFENKVKLAWTGQDPTYDLIIGDSQWLGKGATQGHYVDLTDWAKSNTPYDDMAQAAVKNYGEYPAGSGKLYALPCMGDAAVFAYRKDLFADPANQKAFQAKYGYALATPKTWDEFQQVAEFFTMPDKKLYGAALFYSKDYDAVTMGFDQVLWAYGGKLSDNGKVEGVINSPEAVKALTYYVGLKKFTPPGSENYYFAECLRDFQEGKVAIAQSWFAFLPGLTDQTKNKFADQTGYFMVPKGPSGQYASLGGQGISVSAYSKKQEMAKEFIAWFSKKENQAKWVALGGLTANNKVAATEAFTKATPYNAVFTQTVPYLKDFYNTPNYSDLLTPSQKYLNEAVAETMTPKEALDAIAKEQQTVMTDTAASATN